jgi:hypothetical protein
MKRLSRSLLLLSMSLCLGAEATDAPLIVAQNLPGRLPGTLPGQQPPAAPSPAPALPAVAKVNIPAACCDVTEIDAAKSIVKARERASGRIVEFKVSDAALLQKLRVGQDVHANFDSRQVSVDGKTMCCAITSVAAAPVVASKAPAAVLPAKPAEPAKAAEPAKPAEAAKTAAPSLPSKASPPEQPKTPAMSLPAKASPAEQPTTLATSTPSRASPAELPKTPATSLPSRASPTELPKASGPLAQAPSGGKPLLPQGPSGRQPSPPESPKTGLAAGAGVGIAKGALEKQNEPIPQVTAGAIRQAQAPGSKLSMQVAPRSRNPNILQLNGIDEIRGATSLPEGARDMLVMHARTLEAQDMDGYIVNRQLAEEWFKKMPKLPDSVHEAAKDKGKKKKKGCSVHHISTGCVKNEVSQAVDDLTETWRKAYRDTTAEVGRAWNRAQDCFADHDLAPLRVPVKFSVTPEFPVDVQRGGVRGNVTVGVPIAGDFTTQLKLFYIPCLPFAIRPKTLGADGTMETGGTLRANLTVSGQFDHTFLVPPSGGVKIPIQVIPIVVGGVPIAEMDVSVYVEGNVKVDGKGTLNGNVKLQSTQKTAFDFECSGHGCNLSSHGVPTPPATAMESVKLDGRLHVKPAIYTALQLSFDWELLEARAGPQPFLLGELYGCAAAAAMQSASGASSSTGSQSVVADLDWGLDIRAEALAAKKEVVRKVFKVDVSHGTSGKNAHIYFQDLVQSTGLVPAVAMLSPVAAGQPAAFMITMPECYPYHDAQDNTLQYMVTWTGGASGSAGTAPAATKTVGIGMTKASASVPASTCTFQGAQATCSGTPRNNTAINLTWPAAGDYVLTVAPVSDKHGHKFDASRAKQVNVKVQ